MIISGQLSIIFGLRLPISARFTHARHISTTLARMRGFDFRLKDRGSLSLPLISAAMRSHRRPAITGVRDHAITAAGCTHYAFEEIRRAAFIFEYYFAFSYRTICHDIFKDSASHYL